MTNTTTNPTAMPTDCPSWCADHGRPHQILEPAPEGGSRVMHSANIGAWRVVSLAEPDGRGRQLSASEPQVSPRFEWVSGADVRQAARELLSIADELDRPF